MSIAIDFGTTNTCVAVSVGDEINVIRSDQGEHQTPSCVAFVQAEDNQGDRTLAQSRTNFVGRAAKLYRRDHPHDVVYDLKRLIGCRLRELTSVDWTYSLMEQNDTLRVKIHDGKVPSKTPEDIIAIILCKMKNVAEEYLGPTLTEAAFTVPHYFTQSQRRLLSGAAKRVGLALSMVEEPIAAAYKYGIQKLKVLGKFILVIHLGGKTLSATILYFNKHEILQVKENGCTYNNSLGGDNFNGEIMHYWMEEIQREHGIDIRGDEHASKLLCDECEEAKKSLSRDTTYRIHIPGLLNGNTFQSEITRDKFEALTKDLCKRILNLIGDALQNAGIGDNEIGKVILVGGAMRISQVYNLLCQRFGQGRLEKDPNPDETVTIGALKWRLNHIDEELKQCGTGGGVGIDFGTTFSTVARSKNKQLKVLEDWLGDTAIPSCVAYRFAESQSPKNIMVGAEAKNYGIQQPSNCIVDVKRMMGRHFEDLYLQDDRNKWQFTVAKENGSPIIQVEYDGIKSTFSPEEVSAEILKHLKGFAKREKSLVVQDVVLAVPTRSVSSQRKATKDAAGLAGLNVLEIIHESAAAILAHGLNEPRRRERNVLVFDLGGGTLDIGIFRIDFDGNFYERATAGHNHLGGEDFTLRMLQRLVLSYLKENAEEIDEKEFERDININRVNKTEKKFTLDILRRLISTHLKKQDNRGNIDEEKRGNEIRSTVQSYWDSCEKGKRDLSDPNIFQTALCFNGYHTKVTRAEFEYSISDYMEEARNQIEKSLKLAGLAAGDIETVVLVGGSSRIPRVKSMLTEEFGEGKIIMSHDPENDVAIGAALYAELHQTGSRSPFFGITRLALGISGPGGVMKVVIPPGEPFPCTRTLSSQMECGMDGRVKVEVYEGDFKMTKKINFIGELRVGKKSKKRKDLADVEITFSAKNDRFEVRGKIKGSHSDTVATMVQSSVHMTEEEIERQILEPQSTAEEDEVREAEETYCDRRNLRDLAEKNYTKIPWKKNSEKHVKAKKTMDWLQSHPDASKNEIKNKYEELAATM